MEWGGTTSLWRWAAAGLLLQLLLWQCGALELRGAARVRWSRQGGPAQAVVLGVAASKYAQSTYLPGVTLENIDVVQSVVVMSFCDEGLAMETAIYDPLASLLHTFFPAPHMDNFTSYQVSPFAQPIEKGVQALDSGFCNRIASPFVTYGHTDELVVTMYALGGLAEALSDDTSNCINKWNVTELLVESGVNTSLFPSPLDEGDPPLSWLTANTELHSFIYFVPAATYGYFISQAMNPYSAIPPTSSTNTTDHIFFRMDWLQDSLVVGPCVNAIHHSQFGFCEGDYITGETTRVLALPTNYDPKLTAGFLDREKGLYVFASQEDPTFPSELEMYVIRVEGRAYAVAYQYAHTLQESYRLASLMIYPSAGSDAPTPSPAVSSTEVVVNMTTVENSGSDVLSAPNIHRLTYVLVSLTLSSSCLSAIAVVIYMQFVYRRRLANEQAMRDGTVEEIEYVDEAGSAYEVH